jgi:hypothetical protein
MAKVYMNKKFIRENIEARNKVNAIEAKYKNECDRLQKVYTRRYK